MPRKIPRIVWVAPALVYLLYFFRLSAAGMLGADEPRYAAIGREMARSGDWITPRLWGQPWFEKPALLYWMSGGAFRLGLGPDLAPRLPVALLAVAFLVFFWWILWREFGCRAAWLSTLILGTTAGWIGFSQVGVTDLPLTATFSAAMLLALPWIARRDTRYLPAAAALLGFAVLAKGLLPLVLAAPLLVAWRYWRDLVRPRVILPFLVVALPWYVLCYLRNGYPFIDVFFVQHQFGRFVSGALMHVQPWWFYLPCLAGLLLPWTPLLALAAKRPAYRDPRRLFLLLWLGFGLVFFSAAANKLPGYVLPLIPAVAVLLGTALDEAESPGRLDGALRAGAGGLPGGRPDSARGRRQRAVARSAARTPLELAAARRRGRRGLGARNPWTAPGRGAVDRRGNRRGGRLYQGRRHGRARPRRFGPQPVERYRQPGRRRLRRRHPSRLALRARLLCGSAPARLCRGAPRSPGHSTSGASAAACSRTLGGTPSG